jgi:hypothetical protein
MLAAIASRGIRKEEMDLVVDILPIEEDRERARRFLVTYPLGSPLEKGDWRAISELAVFTCRFVEEYNSFYSDGMRALISLAQLELFGYGWLRSDTGTSSAAAQLITFQSNNQADTDRWRSLVLSFLLQVEMGAAKRDLSRLPLRVMRLWLTAEIMNEISRTLSREVIREEAGVEGTETPNLSMLLGDSDAAANGMGECIKRSLGSVETLRVRSDLGLS